MSERKHVNLSKFVKLYNEGKSMPAIMTAMGWEPAAGPDPFKRVRAQASFIRTKMDGKVKDEKTGETIKLAVRERSKTKTIKHVFTKVAKAKKSAKAAKTKPSKKTKRPKKGRNSGVGLKHIMVKDVIVSRSADNELGVLKIRTLPRVVFYWDVAEKLAASIEELKHRPPLVKEEPAEPIQETVETGAVVENPTPEQVEQVEQAAVSEQAEPTQPDSESPETSEPAA